MVVDCPSCLRELKLAHSAPGRYQHTCPGCGHNFPVTVPVAVKNGARKKPAPQIKPRAAGSKPSPTKRPAADHTAVGHVPDDGGDWSIKAGPVPNGSAPRGRVHKTDDDDLDALAHLVPEEFEENGPRAPGRFDESGDESVPETADDGADFSVAGSGPEPDAEPEDQGQLPARLGGYEVLRVLGRGGMGAVLLGRQLSLNRKVALKVMHPEIARNPSFVARFTREAYAAAQLTHHNVVQIYDIGEDQGRHFFSMEFVPGRSLLDLLRERGRLTPEASVGYVLQAARGIRQGHKQGMVHRDIKPANLLVNDEGIVKVADLGLVKLPGSGSDPESVLASMADDDVDLTGAGMTVGTPTYMAPEQATSSSTVDGRADIYSLGCTLYALVTGRPPFEGRSSAEVMSKHLTEPVVPPEALVKRVPGALSAILKRMLEKEPGDRYQSMDEVIAALEGFLGLSRSGTFSPSEHETDQLDRLAADYHGKSAAGQKGWALVGFVLVCAAGVVAAAMFGRPVTAVKAFLLLCLAPPAYFTVHGLLSGGVLFARARTLAFGMRALDWLVLVGGAGLLLGTLALVGLLVVWVKLLVMALLLGFYFWMLTDRPQAEAQREPVRDGRLLCRMLRGQGLSEEQLREFVCLYGGEHWEEFFEALFGYEAKLAARALRTGEVGGPWKPHAAWRDPIVAWIDARLDAQRAAREQKHLQKIEARALQAKGISRSEAEERAAELAAVLVDQAGEARKARKAGREADLRGLVRAAHTGRPRPGYNIAGKLLRDLWLRDLLNDWFGRRLRFVLGALVLAAGLFWMQQNRVFDKPLKENPIVEQVMSGQVLVALTTLSESTHKPLVLPPVPTRLTSAVDSYRVPLTGLCLLVSALFYFGWRSSAPAVAGAVVAILGPPFVPDTPAMSSEMLSLCAGTGLILVGGWLLRK